MVQASECLSVCVFVCACACACVHADLLLLLDLAGQGADLLLALAGLALQEAELLLQVRDRVDGQVQGQAEVPHLAAQLVLLLAQTGHLRLALLEDRHWVRGTLPSPAPHRRTPSVDPGGYGSVV